MSDTFSLPLSQRPIQIVPLPARIEASPAHNFIYLGSLALFALSLFTPLLTQEGSGPQVGLFSGLAIFTVLFLGFFGFLTSKTFWSLTLLFFTICLYTNLLLLPLRTGLSQSGALSPEMLHSVCNVAALLLDVAIMGAVWALVRPVLRLDIRKYILPFALSKVGLSLVYSFWMVIVAFSFSR